MEIEELLVQLNANSGLLPRRALKEAMDKRVEVTPHLLKIIEETTRNAVDLDDQPDYMAHLYAMFLLAQFREAKAYPLIVEFFSLPGEISLDLTGDVVTEDLDRILASVCNGDLSGIERLIKSPQVNEWVRGAAMGAILEMGWAGLMSREAAVDYYRGLFGGGLERKYSQVWNALASCATDLYPEELQQDIRLAYEEGLVDPGYMEYRHVEAALSQPKEAYLHAFRSRSPGLIGDTVEEMESWACFQEKPRSSEKPAPASLQSPGNRLPKPGRNEPCFCGSGKKYKKCCGR